MWSTLKIFDTHRWTHTDEHTHRRNDTCHHTDTHTSFEHKPTHVLNVCLSCISHPARRPSFYPDLGMDWSWIERVVVGHSDLTLGWDSAMGTDSWTKPLLGGKDPLFFWCKLTTTSRHVIGIRKNRVRGRDGSKLDVSQEERRALLVGTWCGVCAELVRVSTWLLKICDKDWRWQIILVA